MLSGNILLTGLIIVLSCIHFVFTVEGFILVETSKFPRLIWVTSTGLGSAAAADIIIAVSLCYYLTKSRTGFARTDSLITTLIAKVKIYSIIAFICVVTFATMPTNYIWLGFFWLIGKCYVNSLLAALNGRDSLREQVAPQDGTFLQLTPFRAVASGQQSEPSSPVDAKSKQSSRFGDTPSTLAVTVQTQTVSKTDYEYLISPPPTTLTF
ncbi:hypothetical protein BJ912DRAFT_959903 [Pholiota molesta]|nr:hypothetical protein BJ912DRAFT_959903 [Pholiota molesta]